MKRIRPITRQPAQAQGSVSTDVKLAFIGDFIDITLPLVQNKDNNNPADTGAIGTTTTTTTI